MSDHTRVERELTHQLRERAASAQPSPDAWERFVAARKDRGGPTAGGAEEPSPEPELGPYVSMDRHLTTERSNGTTRNRWTAGVVVLAAAALVVVGIVLASGDDETSLVVTDSDPAATAPTTTEPEPAADLLVLDEGEVVALQVVGKVTEATEGSRFNVGQTLRSCAKLSADGTYDSNEFPSRVAPVPGTWERDGNGSSFVAEIDGELDGNALTLVQTGSVTLDEDRVLPDGSPRLELTGESTVSSTDGTVVVRISDTGFEIPLEAC